MITGPFGSGKSMTVFYVALRLEDVDGFDIMIVLRSSTVNFKLSEIKLQCTYERSMLSRIVGWYIGDLDVISNFILTFLLKTCFTKLACRFHQPVL
jgi:hypothetical protein